MKRWRVCECGRYAKDTEGGDGMKHYLTNKRYLHLLLCLLTAALLMTSCRGGGTDAITQGTDVGEGSASVGEGIDSAVTDATDRTDPSDPNDPPTVDVGDLGGALGVKEICNIVNERARILFDGQARTKGSEAASALELMLPYLLSDSSEFTSAENYYWHDVTVTGEGISVPEEIICRDGITLSRGTDPEYGDYREIEYSHENGVVYLSAYGGVTTVDGIVIDAESSLLGSLDAAPLILLERDLIEETKEGVWRVGDVYMRGIWRALFSLPSAAGLLDNDMRGTLDVSEFHSKGTIVLNVKLKYPLVLELELRLEGIGSAREYYELTVIASPEDTVTLGCGVTEGVIDEVRQTVRLGEETEEIVQRIRESETELSMEVRSADDVTLSCKIALEMVDAATGRGTVEAVYRVGGNTGGDIIPLSSAVGAESVSRGEFSVRLADGAPAMMEMAVTAQTGTAVTETEVMLVKLGAGVGDSVMYYAVRLRDSAAPADDVAMAMEVKLESREGEVSRYRVGISLTDADGTSTAHATVTTPTTKKVTLNFRETVLTERAETFLNHYEVYLTDGQAVANSLSKYLTPERIDQYPTAFYVDDGNGDGILFWVQIFHEDGYEYYVDVLLDAENYTYLYNGYNPDMFLMQVSGMEEDASLMNARATGREGYTVLAPGEAIYYSYVPEEKLYILWDATTQDCGYMLELPTAEDFPDRVLHRAQYDDGGNPQGEVHSFEATYDEAGRETLCCSACHLTLQSKQPVT